MDAVSYNNLTRIKSVHLAIVIIIIVVTLWTVLALNIHLISDNHVLELVGWKIKFFQQQDEPTLHQRSQWYGFSSQSLPESKMATDNSRSAQIAFKLTCIARLKFDFRPVSTAYHLEQFGLLGLGDDVSGRKNTTAAAKNFDSLF
ncbi:hypothetical protein RRG08_034776 [Elysia crispata]|uniref:Uncharacterized protein n=1 Tax=Elysia crispata TaxID=231223 RepID=A0AAE1CV25_9GAST|nr:hypothetical protein RRG08_034776 [Elysia crispata]